MSAPLKQPPVYFNVAQVRFNEVLKMGDLVPSIQEAMRAEGYPDFIRMQTIEFQLSSGSGKDAAPVTAERFMFGTLDKEHAFLLDTKALTFQSTNYGHYESFSERFIGGLKIVQDAVKISFIDRVGLRYLDHVVPKEGDALEQYLVPAITQAAMRGEGVPLHAYIETARQCADDVQLVSRILFRRSGLTFPPDLQPGPMAVQERFKNLPEAFNALVDTDGSVSRRGAFSIESVRGNLNAIHRVIGRAFGDMVTTHALKVWDEK